MIDTIISIGEKLAGILPWIIGKSQRPRIRQASAPLNVFEQFGPGTTIERMKEILGAPYREHANRYGYKFTDALVQIESENGTSVTALGVALLRKHWRTRFQVYPHPSRLILGKATLHDVFEDGMKIHHEYSSKEDILYVEAGYGFPGLYRTFTFGVIHAPFVKGASFEWDQEHSQPKTSFRAIPLNWAAVSLSPHPPVLFDYWLFM